jgi:hypothetical protein
VPRCMSSFSSHTAQRRFPLSLQPSREHPPPVTQAPELLFCMLPINRIERLVPAQNGGSGALDCGLTVRLGHRCFSDEASHVNA